MCVSLWFYGPRHPIFTEGSALYKGTREKSLTVRMEKTNPSFQTTQSLCARKVEIYSDLFVSDLVDMPIVKSKNRQHIQNRTNGHNVCSFNSYWHQGKPVHLTTKQQMMDDRVKVNKQFC